MNYSPRGMFVWDAWFMATGQEVHAYHLQRERVKGNPPDPLQDCLGHAVTTDLIDWQERAPAFGPGAGLADDDLQPWTGCALWHQDRGYLFYTMRGSANRGREQKIGLATAAHPDRWKRSSGNPVLVPDPQFYATAESPVPGVVDCRDLHVIPAPQGGWLGFFATRIPGRELPETSVIGCAHSEDLRTWRQLPPAFAPGHFACVEVPDVFFLNGRWYLMCLAGNYYGNRGIWTDPHLVNGTICAVADRPEGPYHELPDNALIAARTTGPLSARSLSFQGETFVLYTDRERVGRHDGGDMTFGTLTTPKLLATSGDQLQARYCPRIETRVRQSLFHSGLTAMPSEHAPWGQLWPLASGHWKVEDAITAECRTGWSVRRLGCSAESFIFEARVELRTAVAAGFALRLSGPMQGAIVSLDAGAQAVAYAEAPAFDFEEKRSLSVERGRSYHLRIVQRIEHVEVYVDHILKLAFSRYRGLGGEMGLFVDRGSAFFSEVSVRTLEVRPAGTGDNNQAGASVPEPVEALA